VRRNRLSIPLTRGILFVLLTAAFAVGSTITFAQPRGAHSAPHRRPKADAGAVATEDAATEVPTRAETIPVGRDAGPHPGGAASKDTKDKDVIESKTLDGGAKVFRFGEVEIEGRLQSPQLVYFLRRVRAEFAAGDLGHRSFLREMSDTRTDPSF
jgi:hypothetical protein